VEVSGSRVKVELGEGVFAQAKVSEEKAQAAAQTAGKADVSALGAMLQAKWKSGGGASATVENVRAGQIRSFRIVNVEGKKIELELV